MDIRTFRRLVALLSGFLALGLLSAPVFADDPTLPIFACVRAGGTVSEPAGTPLTFVAGWTMSTRGNTQAFANAATGVMTLDGQPVTPVESDVYSLGNDVHPDGNADDPWRVQWSLTATAPAQGQSMVVTFNIVLARAVADHEVGAGQPAIIPAGPLFPQPVTCTVVGT